MLKFCSLPTQVAVTTFDLALWEEVLRRLCHTKSSLEKIQGETRQSTLPICPESLYRMPLSWLWMTKTHFCTLASSIFETTKSIVSELGLWRLHTNTIRERRQLLMVQTSSWCLVWSTCISTHQSRRSAVQIFQISIANRQKGIRRPFAPLGVSRHNLVPQYTCPDSRNY